MSHAAALIARPRLGRVAVHGALLFYTLVGSGRSLLVLINAFKSRRAIFNEPSALPISQDLRPWSASTRCWPNRTSASISPTA